MSDRTKRLVELAALAHEYFGPLVGLPALANIELCISPGGGELISAQLYGFSGERETALWAREMGCAVRITDKRSHVECFAETAYHGATVRVWTHLTHGDAWRVLSGLGLGLVPNAPVWVDASELLRAPAVAEAAVA